MSEWHRSLDRHLTEAPINSERDGSALRVQVLERWIDETRKRNAHLEIENLRLAEEFEARRLRCDFLELHVASPFHQVLDLALEKMRRLPVVLPICRAMLRFGRQVARAPLVWKNKA